jgi:Domain of unknown function (DUF4124)
MTMSLKATLFCKTLLGACALFAWMPSHAGAADLYKWTDAEDRVHYSNAPPAGTPNLKKVDTDAAPVSIVHGEGKPAEYWREKSKEFDKRRADQRKTETDAEAKVAAAEAKSRAQRCEFLRKDLQQVIENRQRVTERPDGMELSDAERAQGMNNFERGRTIGLLEEQLNAECN